MQIILEEDEIKAALVSYATSMINIKEDQEISIDMKAGRGENGYSATLNIQPKAPAAPVKTVRSKPTAVEAPVTKPALTAPTPVAKTGLFTKPAEVVDVSAIDSTLEGEPEDSTPVEEVVSAISTGEERVDPTQSEPEATAEEVPADKPKSIFNFAKPAAAGA